MATYRIVVKTYDRNYPRGENLPQVSKNRDLPRIKKNDLEMVAELRKALEMRRPTTTPGAPVDIRSQFARVEVSDRHGVVCLAEYRVDAGRWVSTGRGSIA